MHRPVTRSVVLALLVLGAALAVASPDAGAADFAAECRPPTDTPTVTIGVVDCQRIDSTHVGGVTAFSYFVPERCAAPPAGRGPCPVVYYLHGTGGTYRQGTGPVGSPSPWVEALTSGPAVDPRAVSDPWNHADPDTWVPRPPLDLILVAPHGLTVPGGHGTAPHLDTGWADWNPKYAQDGAYPRYDTPPPRVETFLVEELVPYVDAHFPTVGDRRWRAITGKSQGGFGSFANGLAHPDVWSVQAMLSGGGFPFPTLLAEGTDLPDEVDLAAPTDLPYLDPPGPVPTATPEQLYATFITSEVTVGFGDPVVDHVWWRGINPVDLIPNARAWDRDGHQSTYLKYHVNDAIPRRAEDLTDPNYPLNQGYETLLLPMDLYMEQVFDRVGVERTFHLGPGLHNNDPYQQPYYREHLEAYAANLEGTGTPRRDAERFDYGTHRREFEVWDWRFEVEREPDEFLYLTEVTCERLTLRGSGVVTVMPPPRCGRAATTVDLGPSGATDEPAGAGSVEAWGHQVTVELERPGRG